ncbi:MAG: DUF11 domain-containing protein [Bacteroidales bacterium]|nr:DUF11 domain-containing protein [Bacteroidales bacterium]
MKRLFFVLITHIVATQALFAQLEIETTVPTGFDEAINVGVGTGHFETIVKNKSGVETITGIKVTPLGGLDGLEILTNATYEYNGTVYSASVTGDLIQTNGSMRLMAGEQIKFIYEKRAKCSIVPQASSGYSMQVVDDISVLGTDYSEQTNSYPVLFPGLSVIVPESPLNNKQVEYRENFSDEVTIKNEQNSGKVNSLIIRMEYNQQVISVNKIEIQGSAGTIERNITANNVEIRLEPSDLETLGFENGIMPANSQFKVVSYGRVEEYSATTQVKYSVDYVAFNENCQRLKNAEGIMYFQQTYPNPQLAITSNIISKGNFCGKKLIVEYLIESINIQNPSNYLLDMYINTAYSNGYSIDSVICNDVALPITNQRSYLWGVGNIDNNNIAADYNGDRPIKLKIIATPRYSITGFNCKFFIRIEGKKINDDSFLAFPESWEESQKKSSSYVTGDATIDDVIKPNGTYTYDYNVQLNSSGKQTIDYSLSIRNPNGSFDQIGGTSDGGITTYKGTTTKTITACEDPNPKFQVVLKTENCEDKPLILTEATPDVIQRCHIEGEGGACYAGNVTEATFNRKEINTCDTVLLQAKGTVSYNCGENCPRYKSVAVSVEDKSKSLPIKIKDAVLQDVSSTYNFDYRDGIIAYEFPIQLDCPDKDSVMTKELLFRGNLFVNGHIDAERIDANIQVRYMLIGQNDTVYDGTLTWGDMLTVYDPKPSFGISTSLSYCSDGTVIARMGKGASTGTPARIQITEVTFPAQPDFYYATNGLNATGMPYTISNLQWEASQGHDEFWDVSGLRPKCAEDGKLNSKKTGVIQYEDFYGTSCQRTVRKDNVSGIAEEPYEMPKITLYPTERQQSVESTTTWTLLVENTGHSTARHVMLRLTPNEGNSMIINIEEVQINGQVCNGIRRRGGSVYVPMPSNFLKSSQKVITITASYERCSEYGISTIDVESAWSCEELTENNFDDFNCGGTAVLELENMVAVLSAIETYPKEYFHLCEDIPIHLNISNIGRAELNQLGVWFDKMPKIYTLTNNSVLWNYNGKNGTIVQGMDLNTLNSVDLFHENANLSVIALKENTNEYSEKDLYNPLSATSFMNIDFKIKMHCDGEKNIIKPINFSIGGYTNCQAKQIRNFQFKPKFEEFKELDSLSVQATVDNKTFEYGGVRNFTATVQNLSNALVDSAYVTVTYPNDLQYIGYDATRSTGVVDEEIIDNNDGTTTVEWKLQEGIHLAPHEQISVYYQLQAKQLCGQALEVLTQGTLLRKMRDCDGTECDFKNSTDAVTLTVTTPNPQFSATISEIESTCNGNNETYVVSGIGIESIEWSVSPETIGTLTSNGQTANMHYTGKGVATISANVVSSCETIHLNSQTTVLDKPNFNITPPDSILWKDWNELGVKAVCTEYAESNWTIPQIDTCGQYTLIYEESNECGSVRESVPIEIYRCCEPEKVSMPDTLYLSYSKWENYTLDSIKATPEGGIWDTLKTEKHGMCGEYKYKYTVTKCDSTATDSIVIIVEDCCTENPHGDLVETERTGVTTYDVEVLRQYVKDNTSLIQDTDLYETYMIKMWNCDTYKYVPVVPCFKKWADINEDGRIDENDVELLIQYVK